MAKFPGTAEVRCNGLTPAIAHVELVYTDGSATYTVPVKAGMFVHEVGVVVTQDFDGSPALVIGDGTDDDGYMDSADIALGTAATGAVPAVKLSRNSGNPYANGKYYAVDDTIDFKFTAGTAPTKGKLKGFVIMSSVRNAGIDA